MSGRRQYGQSGTLPIKRGVGFGAAVYVIGYIVTYVFVQLSSNQSISESAFGQTDFGMADIVGWAFYNTHFVDTTASAQARGQSQTQSSNLLSQAAELTPPEVVWYLVPVVLLTVAGYLTAKRISRRDSTAGAAKAGATVVAGYLPLAAVGLFVFTKTSDVSTFQGTATLSVGPKKGTGVIVAGAIYPALFGTIGGVLASMRSSSPGPVQPDRQPRAGGHQPRQQQSQQNVQSGQQAQQSVRSGSQGQQNVQSAQQDQQSGQSNQQTRQQVGSAESPNTQQQRSPRTQQRNDGTSRRTLLLGGAGVVAAGGAGWYFFLRGGEGPEAAAKEFVETIDDGELDDADSLIHSRSPIDGSGQAIELLAIGSGINVSGAVDTIDISVTDTETVRQDGDRAIVRLTLELSLLGQSTENTVDLEMRKEDGDWRVWNAA